MLNREKLHELTAEHVERRREPRVNQPAAVTVWMEQPGRTIEFQSVLVNSSDGGLAIRHWRKELLVGQQVRISDGRKSEFVATVRWNWAIGPVVISGLDRDQQPVLAGVHLRLGKHSGSGVIRLLSSLSASSWMWAALMGFLIAAGWYVRSKIF